LVRARSAFTIVELLVASALASILVVALLGTLRSLAIQRKTLFDGGTVEPWRTSLTEQLRWDLCNSRQIEAHPEEIRLAGFASRDFQTDCATFRPCEIIYSICDDGRRHWLVRKEVHTDDLKFDNSRSEVVCAGVARLAVARLGEELDDDRSSPVQGAGDAATLADIPDRLRLVLFGEEQKSIVLDETMLLR